MFPSVKSLLLDSLWWGSRPDVSPLQVDAPPLSPFPHIKQQAGSPRRISQQHSLYVSPHKNGACLTPRSALMYKFSGSPSKVGSKRVERGPFEIGLINLIRMCSDAMRFCWTSLSVCGEEWNSLCSIHHSLSKEVQNNLLFSNNGKPKQVWNGVPYLLWVTQCSNSFLSWLQSLKDINNMIKQGEHRSKKRAITIDSDTESPTKRLCQENDDVLLKRLQDVVSERANH